MPSTPPQFRHLQSKQPALVSPCAKVRKANFMFGGLTAAHWLAFARKQTQTSTCVQAELDVVCFAQRTVPPCNLIHAVVNVLRQLAGATVAPRVECLTKRIAQI